MTDHALAFGNQFFTQLVVRIFVDGRLSVGKCCTKKETDTDNRGFVSGFHSNIPSKKPR
jgi:hypothetical protein